ncbi:WAT1-related protein At3g30340-like [Cynara cardunculus var. scolymus]|uniref:WAT1-related protein At3g30340-like n=1 Tax=Cynara cardunculus var. scolymus TaxID=59895 RepID=UPI000D625AAB|nr:WAT1-related protein At3g30340-like [Cynara cardunculus var. scolymus]
MDGKGYGKWYPVLVMIAVHFAFATINVLLKKVIDDGLNHLVFITYRLTVATIFLAPVAFFFERKSQWKLTYSLICHLFLNAILGASLTQYLFLLGIQYTSATFSCAFLNMVPVITFIMSLPFGLETVNIKSNSGRAKVIGTLVCVGGATLLTLYKGVPLFNHHSHLQDTINVQDISRLSSVLTSRKARWTSGSLALIAGSILWSSWFLVQSNIGKRYPLQYSSTAIMMFFGAIQSFVLSMSLERDISSWILKGKLEIFSVFYAGIIGSGFCFVAMSWCVKKRGPVFCAAFSPLVQMIAALFDIPFLHEPLHLGSLVGSAIVVIGLYILLWGKNKELQTSGVAKGDPDNEKAKVQDPESQVTCDSKDPPTPES